MSAFDFGENEMIKRLMDAQFGYERPWFYSNALALRCDLGRSRFRRESYKRALKIFKELFGSGVDFVFIDHFVYDISRDWQNVEFISESLGTDDNRVAKILFGLQGFPHATVEDIPVDKATYSEDLLKVNRCIAKTTGQKLDYKKYIKYNLSGESPEVHFVSLENDCIYSIYDNRGADIVFFSKDRYKKFFSILQPYLSAYDLEEMKNRLEQRQTTK